ncbi:MAG: hypothetical protein Q4C68_02315 [Moraxella sp.]|nr:hypothetical protein [Moraxella sp.]
MKKLIALLAVPVLLSACTSSGTGDATNTGANTASNIGMAIFSQAVDTRCRSELNKQQIYQTASIIMTAEQKQTFEDKTCGCVAQKAPQSVTLEEMATAAVNQNARAEIVLKAVNKSVVACASEYLNSLAQPAT